MASSSCSPPERTRSRGRNLRRDPQIALLVDDDTPPYAFVHVRGRVTVHEDPDERLRFATAIGARYMGEDRAEEFGRRNAVPGELLVRVTPVRVIAEDLPRPRSRRLRAPGYRQSRDGPGRSRR